MNLAASRGSSAEPLTKITAKFFKPLWDDFDARVNSALLRRDAFLDRMLAVEVKHLDADLSRKPLQSTRAKKYVSDKLRAMKGSDGKYAQVQVSIVLRVETAHKLKEVCDRHRVNRDAFLNRLVAFLRASEKFLQALDLPATVNKTLRMGAQDMSTGPLAAIEEVLADPLHYLRSACEEWYGCGIYDLPLGEKLLGLECYISDEDLPGSKAHQEKALREAEAFEAISFLDELEATPEFAESIQKKLREMKGAKR